VPGFDGLLLPPPPQPKREKDREAINSTQQSPRNERCQRLIFFGVNARPKAAVRARPPAGSQGRPERWPGFQICRQTGLELCRSKVWWSWERDCQTELSLREKGGHAALSKVPVPSDNKSRQQISGYMWSLYPLASLGLRQAI
jgi:hypothetical protein